MPNARDFVPSRTGSSSRDATAFRPLRRSTAGDVTVRGLDESPAIEERKLNPTRGELEAYAAQQASEKGIDPATFLALIDHETGGKWDNALISPKGARGLTQLMRGTAEELGVDPDDPYENIRGGATYFADRLRTHNHDYRLALAAYNAGDKPVQESGGVPPFKETRNYVKDIPERAKRFAPRVAALLGVSDARAEEAPGEAKKPATWTEVLAHPGVKDLSPEEFDQLRKQYFRRAIAPRLPESDLAGAWAAFNERTKRPANSGATSGNVAPAATPRAATASRVEVDAEGRPMPDQAQPTSPAVAASPQSGFNTPLSPEQESRFAKWKQQYAPNDSGEDYDLRGAFLAGLKPDAKTLHWPDTFKKPNHPTFSNESKYARFAPEKAGRWEGETFVPSTHAAVDESLRRIGVPPASADEVMRDITARAQEAQQRGERTFNFAYDEVSTLRDWLNRLPSDQRKAALERDDTVGDALRLIERGFGRPGETVPAARAAREQPNTGGGATPDLPQVDDFGRPVDLSAPERSVESWRWFDRLRQEVMRKLEGRRDWKNLRQPAPPGLTDEQLSRRQSLVNRDLITIGPAESKEMERIYISRQTPTTEDMTRALAGGAASVGASLGAGVRIGGRWLGAKGLEKAGRWVEDLSQSAADDWASGVTPAGKEAASGDYIHHPLSSVLSSSLQSAPGIAIMATGTGAGIKGAQALDVAGRLAKTLGAMGVSAERAAVIARAGVPVSIASTVEGGFSALQNAQQTGNEVRKMDQATLATHPYYKLAYDQTDTKLPKAEREQRARNLMANAAEDAVLLYIAPWTTLSGFVTGGGVLGNIGRATRGGWRGLLDGGKKEAVQEFWQSYGEQIIQDAAALNYYDENRSMLNRAANQAVLGAATGLVTGLGFQGASMAGRKEHGANVDSGTASAPPGSRAEPKLGDTTAAPSPPEPAMGQGAEVGGRPEPAMGGTPTEGVEGIGEHTVAADAKATERPGRTEPRLADGERSTADQRPTKPIWKQITDKSDPADITAAIRTARKADRAVDVVRIIKSAGVTPDAVAAEYGLPVDDVLVTALGRLSTLDEEALGMLERGEITDRQALDAADMPTPQGRQERAANFRHMNRLGVIGDALDAAKRARSPGEMNRIVGRALEVLGAEAPAPKTATDDGATEPTAVPVDRAAHQAATSPDNDLPEPTEAQRREGNYQKGHVRIGGLDISIENSAGSKRRPEWPTLKSHYGYVKGTEGADSEHVDVFVKPGTAENYSGPVFVIDQNKANGHWDEHKAVIGAASEPEARRLYLENYTPGWNRIRGITPMSMEDFKKWVREGDTTRPASESKQAQKRTEEASEEETQRREEERIAEETRVEEQTSPAERVQIAAREVFIEPNQRAAAARVMGKIGPPSLRQARIIAEQIKAAGFKRRLSGGGGEPMAALSTDPLLEARAQIFERLAATIQPAAAPAPGGAQGVIVSRRIEPAAGKAVRIDGPDAATRAQQLVSKWWNEPTIRASIDRAAQEHHSGSRRLEAILAELQELLHGRPSSRPPTPPERSTPGARASRGTTVFDTSPHVPSTVAAGPEVRAETVRQIGGRVGGIPEAGIAVRVENSPGIGFLAGMEGRLFRDGHFLPSDEKAPGGYQMAGSATFVEAGGEGSKGTLAAQGVGRRSYAAPAAAVKPDADRARPDSIREAMRRLFNVPINEKGVTVRRAAGIYKVKARTIRVRNINDIDVIAHELGHHFSETNQAVRQLMATHAGELLGITPQAYAKESRAVRLEEGFAEFVRLYLTQRSEAQLLAPNFLKDFEQFLKATPRYREIFDEVHGMIEEWFALDPAARILAKVGARPKSILERLADTFSKDRLIFEVLDNWHPLKQMVRDLNPDIAPGKDPFKAAHLLAGDAAVIEDWLVSGTVPYDYTKRAMTFGQPLHAILKPVAKHLREFSAYLIARRAAELKTKGKENLLTTEEINAGLSLETPALKQAAEQIYFYNDRLLDYAVEGGLLSADVAEKFREYTAYIPFFREREDDSSGMAGKGNPFKRLRGGTANLRDPLSNIIQNTANIIYATNRNAVLAKAYELAKAVPGGGRWIEEIPLPKKALEVSTERIVEELKRQGVTVDTTTAQNLATMQTFWQRNPVGDDRTRTIIVKVNGEPKALQINDKLLWQALQAFEPIDLGLIGKALAVPSDLLRAGVTLSPEFMARNFMRDTLSGYMQSQKGLIPIVNTVGGFKEVLTRSDAARLYRAFGGAHADLWRGDSDQSRKVIERMAKRGRFDPRTILTPNGIIRLLHRIGSVSEAGTRVAEFKKTMGPGDIDSLIDAAYNAREVSVDFGMHGHNRTVRYLTRITPFLNPALQGWYKAVRTSRERFFLTLLRGSVLTGFSVLLYLNNRDKDWYDDIEQWEKNVYWHLDVGLRDKEGQVIPVRVPKPFEWGAVFGSVPEGLTEVAIDHNGKRFAKRLGSITEDVFALRTVPTAILVPAEIWGNKNTFTDRPIVPESLERLDPELQYSAHTSLLAREAGDLTGSSPAKIDHLVRGFLGTMGVYGVMLADQGIRVAGDFPVSPASTWRQLPVIKAFVHDPDNPNSRQLNEFHDLLNRTRQAEASYKRYEGEAADAYYEKYQDAIDQAGEANKQARDLAEIRKENREIMESRDYTAEEKRDLIAENNRLIKSMSRDFMRVRSQP